MSVKQGSAVVHNALLRSLDNVGPAKTGPAGPLDTAMGWATSTGHNVQCEYVLWRCSGDEGDVNEY